MGGRFFLVLMLPVGVCAHRTEVTFFNNAEEILQKQDPENELTQQQRKQFMEDFMGQTFDTPPKATIRWYDTSKFSGYGVYRAYLKEGEQAKSFVIKNPDRGSKTDSPPKTIDYDEADISQAIEKTLLNKVGKKDTNYGSLQGLAFLRTVDGKASN